MFDHASGADAYLHSSLEAKAAGSDPVRLVIMLLDGLEEQISLVEGHIQEKRYDKKGASVRKGINILGGLDAALDYQNGAEVAQQLHQLYEFCGHRLFQASFNDDIEKLAVIKRIINNMRDGWNGLVAQQYK
jgi:flagellar secretion chaperone FliS